MVFATASRPMTARMSRGLCMTTSSASRAANCAAVACPDSAKFADRVHEGLLCLRAVRVCLPGPPESGAPRRSPSSSHLAF